MFFWYLDYIVTEFTMVYAVLYISLTSALMFNLQRLFFFYKKHGFDLIFFIP